MATALIVLTQSDGYTTPGSRDNLALSSPITATLQTTGIITQYLWTLIDKPTNSAATLSSTGADTTTFTPDIAGTYLLKIVVNGGGASNQVGAGIKTANLHYRIPAATETTEFSSSRGWAIAANNALATIDSYSSTIPQTLQQAYNNSSPTSIIINSGGSSGIQVRDSNGGSGGSIFEVDSYSGGKFFSVSATQTISNQQLVVSAGNKVGLGTITPTSGYSIAGDVLTHIFKANHNLLLIDNTTANSDSGLALYGADGYTSAASLFLDASDSDKLKIATGRVDTHSNRQTNTKLTIQQNGAVGIGTTSPTSQLHIVGTGHFTGQLVLDAGFSASANSSMNSNKITSLATPTANNDAATKAYVDSQIAAGGQTLQTIYNASTSPVIVLNPTNSTLVVEDANTPISANLFEVDSYGAISKYFTVSKSGATVPQTSRTATIQALPVGSGSGFTTIWGNSATNIYAGGSAGTSVAPVFHSIGDGYWTSLPSWPGSAGDAVSAVWVDSTGRLYVGVHNTGSTGALYITTNGGISWTTSIAVNTEVQAIWGANDNAVYVASGTNIFNTKIFITTNQGSSYTQLTTINDRVNSIFGTSTTDIYLGVGSSTNGTIWHSGDGTNFTQVYSTSSAGVVNAVWGVSGSVYAACGNSTGFLLHSTNSGSTWLPETIPSTAGMTGIFGSSATDIFACSSDGSIGHTILHSNGNGVWSRVNDGGLSLGTSPYAIWGSGFNDFYLTLEGGVDILHLAPISGVLSVGGSLDVAGVFAVDSSGVNITAPLMLSSGLTLDGYVIDPSGASSGQALVYNGTKFAPSTVVSSSYNTIEANGSALTQRANLNFLPRLTATDNSGATRTDIDLASTGIAPGSYTATNLTVDAYGRITSIASGSGGSDAYGGPTIIDSSNVLLTTTSPTTIVNYTPANSGDFTVYVYYRVITAPTTLSITLSWTDDSGAQTMTVVPSSSQSVGVESVAPIYITADAYAISVSATAGTSNQVYVSGSILALSAKNGAGNVVLEKANTFDQQLTTTSPTTVATYTPTTNANHTVYIYYRVVSATTNVSISLSWSDNSGAQTMTILSTTAKTVGSYSISPVYIQAVFGASIVVSITSGTANNVFVSATITQV